MERDEDPEEYYQYEQAAKLSKAEKKQLKKEKKQRKKEMKERERMGYPPFEFEEEESYTKMKRQRDEDLTPGYAEWQIGKYGEESTSTTPSYGLTQ